MKILCLYNNEQAIEIFNWLQEQGHETVLKKEMLDAQWCREQKFDLTVSYTYRYILSREILDALHQNAVNIHNAYLPWNRGADPNIWSILENTPRGVTLHYMDAELDKGDIIAQQLVAACTEEDTLASTYAHLDTAAKNLFKDAFMYYDSWQEMRKEAKTTGSYHRLSDSENIKRLFDSYSINIIEFKSRCGKLLTSERISGGVL